MFGATQGGETSYWLRMLFYLMLWGVVLFPGLYAVKKDKMSRFKILIINIYTWWTVVGWFACLIWAIKNPEENREETMHA